MKFEVSTGASRPSTPGFKVPALFAPLEGAYVFNIAGDVVELNHFIRVLDSVRPGAARLITASGPQVPVAFNLDDSQLRAAVPSVPRTPLEDGIRKTIQWFERAV